MAGLNLADPTFDRNAPNDLILGADTYGVLMTGGAVHGPPGFPSAQATALGWVIMDRKSSLDVQASVTVLHTLSLQDLSRHVQRFWQQNEICSKPVPTPDDDFCEILFTNTLTRDSSGRYSVRLPIREESLKRLGESRRSAFQQLLSVEQRLAKNSDFEVKYTAFLHDYLTQGHMKAVPSPVKLRFAAISPHRHAQQAHVSSLHGGPGLMRYLLTDYWIIQIGTLVKAVARNCVTCSRFQAKTGVQQMEQLPPEHVQGSRPFAYGEVNFAGPFKLVAFRGRGHTTRKGYLAVFVCLASKAIHLELVSDLTAAAFLAAFKRYVSRRGRCIKVFSDNATNFRAADRELQAMFRESSAGFREAAVQLVELGTSWSFKA